MNHVRAPGPRWLYLHGLASSPSSNKARAFVAWGQARGVAIEALDLRVPSVERLSLAAIVERVKRAIDEDGPRGRAVLIGSSLGGLAACRVAEVEPRVAATFLMAPAFGVIARWRARLGEDAWARWRDSGATEIDDHATKTRTSLHYAFAEELAAHEAAGDGAPDVRVPVCIVHGVHDDVVPIEGSQRFAAGRRHVRLVTVEDGHDLAASVPRILEEATRFFAPFGG